MRHSCKEKGTTSNNGGFQSLYEMLTIITKHNGRFHTTKHRPCMKGTPPFGNCMNFKFVYLVSQHFTNIRVTNQLRGAADFNSYVPFGLIEPFTRQINISARRSVYLGTDTPTTIVVHVLQSRADCTANIQNGFNSIVKVTKA